MALGRKVWSVLVMGVLEAVRGVLGHFGQALRQRRRRVPLPALSEVVGFVCYIT